MLVDTHAHLTAEPFADDLADVLRRSSDAGVSKIICVGDHYASSKSTIELARSHAGVCYASAGVHPHNAKEVGDELEETLATMLQEDGVVAVGETGLDYFYDFAPKDVQKDVFRRHIRIARETGFPLIIHNRESGEDVLQILEEEHAGDVGGVLHCFWGTPDEARRALDLGFYLGVGGPITFKKSDELRDLLRDIPLEKLVVETDAPYLAPVPYRGKRNEPAYIRLSAEKLAEIKGVTLHEIAKITTKNAHRLFELLL